MKEPLVIRIADDRYNLRLPDGTWHKSRSREEAAEILFCADLNAYALLQEPMVEHQLVDVEFKPLGRHRWWANGIPMPLRYVKCLLRENGCGKEAIDAIIHGAKLCYHAREWLRTNKSPAV